MKIIGFIILLLLYVVMLSIMVVFERDKPKKIICWSLIFLVVPFIGFAIYIFNKQIMYKKKSSLFIKQAEDKIYSSLVNGQLLADGVVTNDELFNFNEKAFGSKVRNNNSYEFISNYSKFKESLLKDIKSAKISIYLELYKVNNTDFIDVLEYLCAKADENVQVRMSYQEKISRKIIKQAKLHGIKISRYSKDNTFDGMYSNIRNVITIDGEIAYFANMNLNNKQLSTKYDIADNIVRLKGNIVEDIALKQCQDFLYTTGKHIDFTPITKIDGGAESRMQYVSNGLENKVELLLIKAICMAKKSITLELNTFVPSESILQLLKYAIDSNIAVKLMVPLKTDNTSKYYASRAYAKELALMGANVYLYDGYIRFNEIGIDDKYVVLGSYAIDRVHIGCSAQNMLITTDAKAVNYFKKLFDAHINNSYRINNAKYMLLKEKFFKNFV